MFARLPLYVRIWLMLDLVVALFPPLHWAASGSDPIAGIPRSLFYIAASGTFIAASVVVAYFADRNQQR
jgi:hypothetical protein